MGAALAARLAGDGHDVRVWNRSPGKADEPLRAGASETATIAEAVGGVEVVITSLADDGAVRQVALGEDGIRAHLDDGLYVEASTISPELSEELAGRFGHFVAMPVLGRPDVVRDGSATYLAGGPDADLARLEPVLRSLSGDSAGDSGHEPGPARNVLRLPEARLASAAKLASNLLLLDSVLALCEAVTAGRGAGLGDDQLRQLFGASPTVAPALQYRLEPILTGSGPNWWTVDLGRKDARLAVEMAERTGCRLPVTAATRGQLDEASRAGLGDGDLASAISLYRARPPLRRSPGRS